MKVDWDVIEPCKRTMTVVMALNNIELARAYMDGGVFGSMEGGRETMHGILIRHDATGSDSAKYVAMTTLIRESMIDSIGLGTSFVAVATVKVSIKRGENHFAAGTVPGSNNLDYVKIVGENLYGEIQQIDLVTFPTIAVPVQRIRMITTSGHQEGRCDQVVRMSAEHEASIQPIPEGSDNYIVLTNISSDPTSTTHLAYDGEKEADHRAATVYSTHNNVSSECKKIGPLHVLGALHHTEIDTDGWIKADSGSSNEVIHCGTTSLGTKLPLKATIPVLEMKYANMVQREKIKNEIITDCAMLPHVRGPSNQYDLLYANIATVGTTSDDFFL